MTTLSGPPSVGLRGLFSRPVIERAFLSYGQEKLSPVALLTLDLTGWGSLRVSANAQSLVLIHKSWLGPGRHRAELEIPACGWIEVSWFNMFGASNARLQLGVSQSVVDPARFGPPRLNRMPGLGLKFPGGLRWREKPPFSGHRWPSVKVQAISFAVLEVNFPKLDGLAASVKAVTWPALSGVTSTVTAAPLHIQLKPQNLCLKLYQDSVRLPGPPTC